VKAAIIAGLLIGVVGIIAYASDADAANMFLKIADIPGESADSTHDKWIDILSIDWGTANSGSGSGATGGRTDVKSDINDFRMIKELDKSSPKLFLAVANGQSIGDVTFDLTKNFDGKASPILNFKFYGAIVTSYSISGAAGSELPTESFSLNFQKVDYKYTEFDSKGASSGDVKVSWDIAENEGG